MARKERDFKGIWIPKEIWLTPDLSLMEKVLFAEIQSLDNERGCFASNRYFAEFFGISERQVSRLITSLREKGLVTVEVRDRYQRTVRAAGKYARVSDAELSRRFDEIRATVRQIAGDRTINSRSERG